MKVLVIGEYYSTNLGDGVICQTVEYLLQTYFAEIETIDVLDTSGKSSFSEGTTVFYKKGMLKKLANRWSPAALKESISLKKREVPEYQINQIYDLAVYAGGQLINPYFLKQMEAINTLLKEKEIPIAYNAVGFGKFRSKQSQQRMLRLLEDDNVTYLSVRDGKTQLMEAGVERTIHTVCDNAIFSSEVFQVEKQRSKIVGLGIMYIESEKDILISFWRATLMLLDKKGVHWQFFVNGSDEDYLFAEEILALHGCPADERYLKPRPQTPKELVETIAAFEKIISFRLHSHIIAYSLDIPSVAMVWDAKVKSFFEMIGYVERCYDYHHYDSSLLLHKLDSLTYTAEDQVRREQLKEEIQLNLQQLLHVGRRKGALLHE